MTTEKSVDVPDKAIRVGVAVVPYGYDNEGICGWRLPGRKTTYDKSLAHHAAVLMNRAMGGPQG